MARAVDDGPRTSFESPTLGDAMEAFLAFVSAMSVRRDGRDPNDVVAQLLLNKFEPARIIHFESVKARAREFAENQLKRTCPGTRGEIGLAGIAAAITDAVHHATGVRVRELPVKIENLL